MLLRPEYADSERAGILACRGLGLRNAHPTRDHFPDGHAEPTRSPLTTPRGPAYLRPAPFETGGQLGSAQSDGRVGPQLAAKLRVQPELAATLWVQPRKAGCKRRHTINRLQRRVRHRYGSKAASLWVPSHGRLLSVRRDASGVAARLPTRAFSRGDVFAPPAAAPR